MSKSRTKRMMGYYERDTKSVKGWIVEIYSKDLTLKKCKVLAFPKPSAKSNGGYDYNILLEDVLSLNELDKLIEQNIHYSNNARYVSVPGLFDYNSATFIKDGLVSRLKNVKLNIW
jgi:hypothetical protein